MPLNTCSTVWAAKYTIAIVLAAPNTLEVVPVTSPIPYAGDTTYYCEEVHPFMYLKPGGYGMYGTPQIVQQPKIEDEPYDRK